MLKGSAGVLVVLCLFLSACGSKKLDGPVPETGDVALRVLVLEDPKLQALAEPELKRVLESSEKHMRAALGRTVRFEITGRENLQDFFDSHLARFGRMGFSARLDPAHDIDDDVRTALYGRVMELLRTRHIRPFFPLFSLDTTYSNVSRILDTVVAQFESSVRDLHAFGERAGPPFFTEETWRRRSVFAWFTVLGSIPQPAKPADVILTNDLLIFDSLMSIPPQAIAAAGVTPGYTRLYPGVSIISIFPFLSDDAFFTRLRGKADRSERLELVALAISREAGGKLIAMAQESMEPSGGLNDPWIPPFSRALDIPVHGSPEFWERQRPLPRRDLLADYLKSFIRSSLLRGNVEPARSALARLSEIAPEDESVKDLQAQVSAAAQPAKAR